jgi:hypothetical protein
VYCGAVILKVGSIHLPFALTVIEAESIPETLLQALRAAIGPSKCAELAADEDVRSKYNAHDSVGAWASLYNPRSDGTFARVSAMADL